MGSGISRRSHAQPPLRPRLLLPLLLLSRRSHAQPPLRPRLLLLLLPPPLLLLLRVARLVARLVGRVDLATEVWAAG